MFKKIPLLLLALSIGAQSMAFAQENTPVVEKKLEQKAAINPVAIDYNSPMFKNEPLTEKNKQYQELIIKRTNEIYFNAKNYNQKELNELFINNISFGYNEAADLILNNPNVKLDLNATNSENLTPLMAAAITPIKGGNVEYAKKLIDMGANMNQGTIPVGYTPISMAATMNHYKVVALLVLKGAQFMKEDQLQFRPIDHAMRNNSTESLAILQQATIEQLKTINKK